MYEGRDTRIIRELTKDKVVFYCERVILYRKGNQRNITFEVRQKTGWFTSKLLDSFVDETSAIIYLNDLIGDLK